MKKLYSIVLMAAALLIGTSAWADDFNGNTRSALQAAIDNAASGTTLVLQQNVTLDGPIWLGTTTLNGNKKSITLDLHGNNVTMDAGSANGYMFVLTRGELVITNSDKTKTSLVQMSNGGNSNQIFSVYGSYRSSRWDENGQNANATATNTRDEGYFSHLVIDKGVKVLAADGCKGSGIAIDYIADNASNPAQVAARKAIGETSSSVRPIKYHTNIVRVYTTKYEARGFAFGARVDVYGDIEILSAANSAERAYGIKTNGNLGSPLSALPYDKNTVKMDGAYVNYVENYTTEAHKLDTIDAPFVYVHDGSNMKTIASSTRSAAVYASGYAKWLIEGNCDGNIGVFASSGEIDINDATITSSATTYTPPTGAQGVTGSGSAVVINSRDAYAGDIAIEISGDTEVSAKTGFAIEEAVNTTTDPVSGEKETKVENITVTGGTFQGGTDPVTHEDKPAIVVSAPTANENAVVVYGGNVVNGAEVGTSGDLNDLTPATVHTTTMVVDGKQVTVISEGVAPTGSANVAGATGSVKWTGAAETLSANLTLDELEINGATAQVLTIADGVTLNVGRVVMGEKAQIIVNAGAKLIVNGEQGFVAPVATNIVLKNEEGKRSIFLFNPAVTSNKHPNATVELITNSWRNSAADLQWEILGLPTNENVTSIDREGTAPVAISVWENGNWTSLGIIGNDVIDVTKLNKPFAPYDLLANRAKDAAAPKIIIKGQLVGNIAGSLNATHRWTPFANSYTGELDLKAYLTALGAAQNIAQGIWVATRSGNGHLAWDPVDLQGVFDGDAEVLKLAPMQAFLLNNPGTSIEASALDYGSMVWAPATSVPNPAPRRMAASETTAKARVIVTNEQGIVDKVMLRENANNVYALEKYMNEDMNIYVLADEKSAIVNAENMENTYVGFSAVNGGKFTISFANVAGREFTLVDHETGARVAMVEGNTYEFTAAANSANDYRFEIVESAKLPTAIENTEAVKSAKGVYTITGQYVGEMNVWNTLPAGIYVVNGEKRVK